MKFKLLKFNIAPNEEDKIFGDDGIDAPISLFKFTSLFKLSTYKRETLIKEEIPIDHITDMTLQIQKIAFHFCELREDVI